MNQSIKVAFVGNPNCGKTTLFNALTGSKLKVANWPGVTVEKVEGEVNYQNYKLNLIDTPGIYSLSSYTIEERVTRECLMDSDIEVIVNVIDASSLERNLYLTLQLLELGKPIILALNMMDIVRERGMEIDLHRLPELLGDIPVIPVSAIKKEGFSTLLHAVIHHYEEGPQSLPFNYGEEIESKIDKIEVMLEAHFPSHCARRWHAIKFLEYDEEIRKEHPINIANIVTKNYEKQIIQKKYGYIEQIVKECVFHYEQKAALTEKIDSFLTHPIWGMPIFLCIMAIVFFFTFTVGDFFKGYLEIVIDIISSGLSQILIQINTAQWLVSLIINGIIAGVGGILTFLPNIAILFIALAILEDSGYMSRVAYVMDGIMGKVGLSGKAFLPMILGFGCTVPAIMATRALETQEDRYKTMIITPFMSCSARLPIYVLFSGMFFGKYSILASFSMYVIGLFAAILIASILNKLKKGKKSQSLLIELPEYKRPNAHTIRIYVWNKLKDYLTKAGTTIFIASIIIWFLLNYGPTGMVALPSDSFGAMIGKFLVPFLTPAGLGNWQIGVALLSGISAKEVVVSSFTVLFGVASNDITQGTQSLMQNIQAIHPGFGALNAYCLMLFCLLYVPCAATIGTIKKESNSLKFTTGIVIFQILFAWIISVIVFQVGSLFL